MTPKEIGRKPLRSAPLIVDDPNVVGLVGPAFSGEADATGSSFNQAGLVAATPSATNVALSTRGWQTFFRGLSSDGVQGPSVANYMKNTLRFGKVCVVDDSTAYGLGLAQTVATTLGPTAESACQTSVRKGDKEFSGVVSQIKAANPDAVFFSGYYSEAAPLIQQLRDGGVSAAFVSADGTKDQQFVTEAGPASRDTVLSCPCGPAPAGFAAEYRNKYSVDPGTYSSEGYDLATIMLRGIDSGKVTRIDLLQWLRTYNGQGVARTYQWTGTGELTNPTVWIYKVQ